MTDRAVFNRRYTSFNGGGTSVFLLNGTSVTTSPQTTQSFTAGETLIQGDAVYVSGVTVFKATALSGLNSTRYGVIGLTTEAASASSAVSVNTDGIAIVSDANIAAETSLVPGQQYYLSKYSGQITRFSTTSGQITNFGSDAYQAEVRVGTALSTSELEIEIQPPIILY